MALFKKRGPDLIDLVDLQKKGILQKSEAIAKTETSARNDFIDFSRHPVSQTTQSSTQTSNPFDLLSSLTSASASPGVSAFSPSIAQEQTMQTDDKQLATLKVKLEDLEYKLDRFLERIAALEEKFNKG